MHKLTGRLPWFMSGEEQNETHNYTLYMVTKDYIVMDTILFYGYSSLP